MGDHVKVIAGRFEGDTGLIVRVEENFVILFSDLTMHEVGFKLYNDINANYATVNVVSSPSHMIPLFVPVEGLAPGPAAVLGDCLWCGCRRPA